MKVIIAGSGHNVKDINNWDLTGHILVTVNNAWRADSRWTYAVCAEDLPSQDWPKVTREEQVFVSLKKPGNMGFKKAVEHYGGFAECGYLTVLAASYWVLYYLKPSLVGYIGCDMNYTKNSEGHTAFYGVGKDFQRFGISDVDNYLKKTYNGDEEKLKAHFSRFKHHARLEKCAVVNYSSSEHSRLPYMRELFKGE